jgi:1-acyl-sn-glycerol-3-phosphate acyltransferase
MFWWLMKFVLLGPLLRLMYRPKMKGLENIPEDGPAILAANHQSFLDDLLLPLVVPKRKVVFLGKADYFDKWYLRWFFKGANVIPVRRESRSASEDALRAGVRALRENRLVGIFPEGTRSPDGRLYRGKTGVARMALEARVPVIPVAIVGTFDLLPYDRKVPKAGRVELRFGKPLLFERHYETPADRFVLRSVTDEIMYEIMLLGGQEYVDEYASRVKQHLGQASQEQDSTEPSVRPSESEAPVEVPAVRSSDTAGTDASQ